MARESTTVQCYPLDSIINRKIREYETFGWELISNQRCREEGGTTFDGYKKVSTFNKLTFTRDKSAPWYSEVIKLEDRHKNLMSSEPQEKKPSKILLYASIMVLIFALGMLIPTLSFGFQIVPGVPAIVLTVIDVFLFVLYVVKKLRYKKVYKIRFSEWQQTCGQEALEIRKQAEALVNV